MVKILHLFVQININGFAEDYSISSVLTMEILQSCTDQFL